MKGKKEISKENINKLWEEYIIVYSAYAVKCNDFLKQKIKVYCVLLSCLSWIFPRPNNSNYEC